MRLLNLNVERSAHLDRFIPFIRNYDPDVVCLQELVESDILTIQGATGLAHCHFVAMAHFSDDHKAPFGVGILSRYAFEATDTLVYAGGGDGRTVIDRSSAESRFATIRYAIARVRLASSVFDTPIATTHFPWTESGEPTDFQREAVDHMIEKLGSDPILFCGDFNAPRGGAIFDRLAKQWIDHIPYDVTTSIDSELHRAGALELMVDGVFASADVSVDDVRMHRGLSDHLGITATIESRSSIA